MKEKATIRTSSGNTYRLYQDNYIEAEQEREGRKVDGFLIFGPEVGASMLIVSEKVPGLNWHTSRVVSIEETPNA